MSEYMVREEGKNGTIEVLEDRIVRTIKRRMGKNDVQTIPIKAITGVSHNRKTLGTDEVTLQIGGATAYTWKVKDAEDMVAELNGRIYPTAT
ncbi:MAG: hypothetical protein M3P26_04190 [Gemmatimonadota bacterium]|nr:hypothetical protein [Gemmatimonadota bacterium]